MKKFTLTFTLLVTVALNSLIAQSRYSRNHDEGSCPKLYIGFSSGIENPCGLIGVTADVPITQQFSLGTGIGRSSWGFKGFGEGRFYFTKRCNSSWALGAGATYNTGLKNFSTPLPTQYGTQNVPMDLKPKLNVFMAIYKFWSVGRGNRIYINLGYSQRLDEDNYTNLSPFYQLTDEGEAVMTTLAPGGLMIGFGLNFGAIK